MDKDEIIAEKIHEAVPIHRALKIIYERLTDALKNDLPQVVRRVLWYMVRAVLNQMIKAEYQNENVRKLNTYIYSNSGTLPAFEAAGHIKLETLLKNCAVNACTKTGC